MTPPTNPRSDQPRPRERPELDEAEEEREPAPERQGRGAARERGEREHGEAPDMGIGLDERGELDRRFER